MFLGPTHNIKCTVIKANESHFIIHTVFRKLKLVIILRTVPTIKFKGIFALVYGYAGM